VLDRVHGEGQDLADESWLRGLADEHGVPWPHAPRADADLADVARRFASRGVFGVPSFVTEFGVFFGQDRLGALAHAQGQSIDLARWAQGRGGPPRHEGAQAISVEFFHDFASPFSYLGSRLLAALADSHGVDVVWSPILLGGLFREVGTPEVPLHAMPAVEQHSMLDDLHRQAAARSIPLRFPDHFPMRSVLPLRAALVEPQLTPLLYTAAWADNRRIDSPEGLAGVVAEAGFDPARIAACVTQPEIKARLRENTDRARRLGACGVPTYVVRVAGRTPVLLWGADRTVLLEAISAGWWPETQG
jgi:2-hydroxychromene-2-carboxylate isomerase